MLPDALRVERFGTHAHRKKRVWRSLWDRHVNHGVTVSSFARVVVTANFAYIRFAHISSLSLRSHPTKPLSIGQGGSFVRAYRVVSKPRRAKRIQLLKVFRGSRRAPRALLFRRQSSVYRVLKGLATRSSLFAYS
jgi:hypothetical protein